jgi:hypothetical protein
VQLIAAPSSRRSVRNIPYGAVMTCAARLIYEACESRDMRPIIPLKMTAAVLAGWDKPPACDHGT